MLARFANPVEERVVTVVVPLFKLPRLPRLLTDKLVAVIEAAVIELWLVNELIVALVAVKLAVVKLVEVKLLVVILLKLALEPFKFVVVKEAEVNAPKLAVEEVKCCASIVPVAPIPPAWTVALEISRVVP